MSYDNPYTVSYSFGAHDYGNGGDALAIKPPVGYEHGRVRDIHVAATETFTQTTTPAYVRVGTSGDADKYAELNLGALADTDAASSASSGFTLGATIDLSQDAISQLEVTLVAPTGGTPAGIGHTTITVDWF